MTDKLRSYLGFAARSRNLVYGTGAVEASMAKGKVRLIIIAEDTAENTVKKVASKAEWLEIPCVIFGDSDELSKATGAPGRNVFAILDDNFAKVITEQIRMAGYDI